MIKETTLYYIAGIFVGLLIMPIYHKILGFIDKRGKSK